MKAHKRPVFIPTKKWSNVSAELSFANGLIYAYLLAETDTKCEWIYL